MVDSILPATLKEAVVQKQGKTLLGPLNWQLAGLGCTIILGPNGAGKTTLLRLLHGLEKPRSGKISWTGDDQDLYRRQSFIFQAPIVLRRTVLENVIYPLRLRKIRRKEAVTAGLRWLDKVGLKSHADEDAQSLSGGEKQKLALARAVITKPDILLLDEPTANLDGASTLEIESLIEEALQNGVRLVMATHDLGQAKRLASDVVFLHNGKMLEQSEKDHFFNGPQTPEACAFLRGDIVI